MDSFSLILGVSLLSLVVMARRGGTVRRVFKAPSCTTDMQVISSRAAILLRLICRGRANFSFHHSRVARALMALSLLCTTRALAQPPGEAAGEANLRIPHLSQVQFLGIDGHKLLLIGILFCILGLLFGLVIYSNL